MRCNHSMVLQDLDRKTKITVPQEPDFATSHRANRIRLVPTHQMTVKCYVKRSHLTGCFTNDYFRHKNDARLEQDSTSVHRFKARPLNRKVSIC